MLQGPLGHHQLSQWDGDGGCWHPGWSSRHRAMVRAQARGSMANWKSSPQKSSPSVPATLAMVWVKMVASNGGAGVGGGSGPCTLTGSVPAPATRGCLGRVGDKGESEVGDREFLVRMQGWGQEATWGHRKGQKKMWRDRRGHKGAWRDRRGCGGDRKGHRGTRGNSRGIHRSGGDMEGQREHGGIGGDMSGTRRDMGDRAGHWGDSGVG